MKDWGIEGLAWVHNDVLILQEVIEYLCAPFSLYLNRPSNLLRGLHLHQGALFHGEECCRMHIDITALRQREEHAYTRRAIFLPDSIVAR